MNNRILIKLSILVVLVSACQSNKKHDVTESTKSTIRLIDSIVTSLDIIKNPSRKLAGVLRGIFLMCVENYRYNFITA